MKGEYIMATITYIMIAYFSLINIAGFISMGMDKYKARHHLYRIPEKNLFFIAILGGSIGSYMGMHLFRHKTKHKSFVLGIPLIFVLEASLSIFTFINLCK